jgi:hypothetical protein
MLEVKILGHVLILNLNIDDQVEITNVAILPETLRNIYSLVLDVLNSRLSRFLVISEPT